MKRKQSATPALMKTIGLFDGKTEIEKIKAASEQIHESPKGSETIEQASERWRATAFYTQEKLSSCFGKPDEAADKGTFRLTERGQWIFLEQFRNSHIGVAFHWAGVMFRKQDLKELRALLNEYKEHSDE